MSAPRIVEVVVVVAQTNEGGHVECQRYTLTDWKGISLGDGQKHLREMLDVFQDKRGESHEPKT